LRLQGCAIAQAISCWLPTTADQVSAQVRSCGICGGQSGNGAGFLRVLWFPLPITPPNAPHSSSSGAGTVGQMVADMPGGISLTPPQETNYENCVFKISLLFLRCCTSLLSLGTIETKDFSISMVQMAFARTDSSYMLRKLHPRYAKQYEYVDISVDNVHF
jgi:hypothetical protein